MGVRQVGPFVTVDERQSMKPFDSICGQSAMVRHIVHSFFFFLHGDFESALNRGAYNSAEGRDDIVTIIVLLNCYYYHHYHYYHYYHYHHHHYYYSSLLL